jgi:nitrogen regulatory protein P-II 1
MDGSLQGENALKEIKAFVSCNRVAEIVKTLRNTGCYSGPSNLSVVDVAGTTLQVSDSQERDFSLELGEVVVNEVKLELVCEDEYADEAVRIIQENGYAGQRIANWVCIIDIGDAYPIDTD